MNNLEDRIFCGYEGFLRNGKSKTNMEDTRRIIPPGKCYR